jgi:hypothetical protein
MTDVCEAFAAVFMAFRFIRKVANVKSLAEPRKLCLCPRLGRMESRIALPGASGLC